MHLSNIVKAIWSNHFRGRSWVQTRSGQTKDYKIGICCFSAKHAALKGKSKDGLARNQDNVSEWGNMSIRGLLFQWASTTKIQLSILACICCISLTKSVIFMNNGLTHIYKSLRSCWRSWPIVWYVEILLWVSDCLLLEYQHKSMEFQMEQSEIQIYICLRNK
jgi:hypothetical protein